MKKFLGILSMVMAGMICSDVYAASSYFLPDEMIIWCKLDVENTSKEKLEDCMHQICSDCTSSDLQIKETSLARFRKMKLESVANAFVVAHEAKINYANADMEDKAADTNKKAAEGKRTTGSGNGMVNKYLQEQAQTINMLKAALLELKALQFIEDNCAIFVKQEQKQP